MVGFAEKVLKDILLKKVKLEKIEILNVPVVTTKQPWPIGRPPALTTFVLQTFMLCLHVQSQSLRPLHFIIALVTLIRHTQML